MTARYALVTLSLASLSLITAGCCQPACSGKVRARQATPLRKEAKDRPATARIHLTGLVHHVSGKDTHVDLKAAGGDGVAILANCSFRVTQDVVLDVYHDVDGRLHDYDVLAGPDRKRDPHLDMQVKTSEATPDLEVGWIVVVGRWPLAQTKWVSGSAPGSSFVVRIENNPDPDLVRHYVYNIDSKSVVDAKWRNHGQSVPVPPGMHVVFKANTNTLPTPQGNKGDPFLDYITARAAAARFDLNPEP